MKCYANIQLPEGWKLMKIGDVFERISNGCSLKQLIEKVGYPITRIETISNELIDLNRVRYVRNPSNKDIEKYQLKYNDILFSHINSDTHLGKTAIFKIENQIILHGINLLLLRPKKDVNADFINYVFKYLRFSGIFIKVAQHAVNQSSINQTKLKAIDIPLPPLPEQHNIVTKIEELFSELDTGIKNLKKAKEQIKTYRQSVLNHLINKSETISFGDCLENIKYGTSKKCSYESGDIPVLRIPNIENGSINDTDLKFSFFTDEEKKIYKLKEGDILIIRSNGSISIVGTSAIVSKKHENYIYAGYLIRLRFDNRFHYPKFYNYLLQSTYLREQIESTAKSTSGVNNINAKEIQKLKVPIFSKEEQIQIVSEIEKRFSVAGKMEESIDKSLQQAEALRQSILKKAFEGKLI